MARVEIRPNRDGIAGLRRAIAVGLSYVMLDAETEAKRDAPVRGGHRSFQPGTRPVGGTLRRSIHSATFLDGRLVALHAEDASGAVPAPLPDMEPLPGRIVGYVGTNSGYGAYVDLGTRKMPPRPFLAPGLARALARAGETLSAGIRRAGG